MAFFLSLETATTVCSVALAENDRLLASREINEGYAHSENITVFIDEVLKEAGRQPSDLDAVAVSSGPGSYTGLRIGVSTAKGLCYALDKPLIAVDTLRSMAAGFVSGLDKIQSERGVNPGFMLTDYHNYKRNYPRALEARQNPTEAEEVLWSRLKSKLQGHKFRRQHVIDQFIVDFVCISKMIIVEVDGGIHIAQKEYDAGRDSILKGFGFEVLRFTNEEVLTNTVGVLEKIRQSLASRTDLSPDPFPKERGAGADVFLVPMIDARRLEVYCAVFDKKLNELEQVTAKIIDENSFAEYLNKGKVYFFGDGAKKCEDIIRHKNAVFSNSFFPSAKHMIPFAMEKLLAKEFEDLASFEPFYLKDFVPGISKSKI